MHGVYREFKSQALIANTKHTVTKTLLKKTIFEEKINISQQTVLLQFPNKSLSQLVPEWLLSEQAESCQ